jgi:hypothetical protein
VKSIIEFQVDKIAWAALSNDEQTERKKEWATVKHNLKSMAGLMRFHRGYLTAHKALFFKGDVDLSDEFIGEKFGYKFHLFYLWYYPTLNRAKCRELMERMAILDKGPRGESGVLLSIRYYYFHNIGFAQASYESDYGMMGGREQLIIEELMGEPGKGAFFDLPDYYTGDAFSRIWLMRCILGAGSVLRGVKGRRYEVGQYIWPHASYILQKRLHEKEIGEETEFYIARVKYVISMILFFDEHPSTAKDDIYAIAAKDRIVKQYENGDIIGDLEQWFDEVKSNGWELFTPS